MPIRFLRNGVECSREDASRESDLSWYVHQPDRVANFVVPQRNNLHLAILFTQTQHGLNPLEDVWISTDAKPPEKGWQAA